MRNIDKYSKDYLKLDFERIQEKYRKRKILEILNRYKPKKILEVGCGIDSIENYYNCDLTIIEPVKDFTKNLKAKVINDCFENVNLNENFDFILVSGLLHEVSNVDKFLLHLKKIAKNSIIHINVPNAKSFHKLLGVSSGFLNSIYEKTPTHKILQQNSVFDMDTLVKLLEKYKFEVIDKGGYFIKPFSHSQMAKILEYEIIDEKILDGLYNLKELEEFSSEIFVNVKVKDENN